jgi:ADP-ribosylglycohydrolase
MNKDQVCGMYLGVAIGDALGLAVETFSPEKILEKYPETKGRITEYLVPTGHKWFDGRIAGTTTDDTQLTIAVSESIVESNDLDIYSQIRYHVAALKEGDKGWGGSTKRSVRRLANGVPYTKSGESGERYGRGNGVIMKISPVAAFLRCQELQGMSRTKASIFEFLRDLTIMTHPTQMAVVASFSHLVALNRCLKKDEPEKIADAIAAASIKAKEWQEGEEEDDLSERLQLVKNYKEYDASRCIEEFGGGSCYCYNSLPFTYMFFLRNPKSMDAMYDVVSAGGDTDTNGSMVGAMLGAYNGMSIFPENLIKNLDQVDLVFESADRFCKSFNIE